MKQKIGFTSFIALSAVLFTTQQLFADNIVIPIAGNGIPGKTGIGESALQAGICWPIGIALDKAGSLYVTDYYGYKILKITANGFITTLAGDGYGGYKGDGGIATKAQVTCSSGVACDDYGNVYIADTGNHKIRKVDINGIITTIAGTGKLGFSGDGGKATEAQLFDPIGITVAKNGSIYFADTDNNRIRKIDASGIITTVAGCGIHGYAGDGALATSAYIDRPHRLAIAPNGELYISDTYNHCIRKVSSEGIITTIAGTGAKGYGGDGGNAKKALLRYPRGILIDDYGNVYIADTGNHRIRVINSEGIINTLAGSGEEGFSGDFGLAISAELKRPCELAIISGMLYFSDSGNRRIRAVKLVPSALY